MVVPALRAKRSVRSVSNKNALELENCSTSDVLADIESRREIALVFGALNTQKLALDVRPTCSHCAEETGAALAQMSDRPF